MGVDHLRPIRIVEAPRWKAAEYGHTLEIRGYYDLMLDYLDWYLDEGFGMELDVWSLLDYWPGTGMCRLTPVKHCPPGAERLQSICGDARQMPFVTAAGCLTLCNQFSGWEAAHGVDLGNVYRTPLTELLRDSPFTRRLLITRAQIREHNPECRACEFRDDCGCGCRALAMAANEDLLGKDPTACAFFKGGYRERFEAVLSAHGIRAV